MSQNKNFIEEDLIQAFKDHDYVKASTLMDNDGWNPAYYDAEGHCLLHYAISPSVPIQLIERLCRLGANVNCARTKTPLHNAVNARRLDIIKTLVKWGADPKFSSKHARKLLTLAVDLQDLNIVKYLVEECRIDVNTTKKTENSALDYAFHCGNLTLIAYLDLKGGNANYALTGSDKEYYQYILALAKGNDVTTLSSNVRINDNYCSTFTYAVLKGHLRIAQKLFHAKIPHRSPDSKSVLFYAVQSSSANMVEWVLSKPEFKEDLNKRSRHVALNLTPLDLAAQNSFRAIIRVLIRNGALTDLMDKFHRNAAMNSYLSSNSESYRTAALLFDLGSSLRLYPPYPVGFDIQEKWLEGYKWVAAFFKKSPIVQILASFIEAEYFQKTLDPITQKPETRDCLRTRHPELLFSLIKKIVQHATPLLVEKLKKEELAFHKKTILERLNKQNAQNNTVKDSKQLEELLEIEYQAILKNLADALRDCLLNRLETYLEIPPFHFMISYYRAKLMLHASKQLSKASFSTLENLFTSEKTFPNINPFFEEFDCQLPLRLINSSAVGEFECQLDPTYIPSELPKSDPNAASLETKPTAEQVILGLDDTSGTASKASLHSNSTSSMKKKENEELKPWSKFKQEKLALLTDLHNARNSLAERIVQKVITREKALASGSQESSLVRFSIVPKKPILADMGSKTSEEATNTQLNNPGADNPLVPPLKPTTDKWQNIATLFSMLEQGRNMRDNTVIALRNKIVSEVPPEILQRGSLLLLEPVSFTPVDPKPLLLGYLQSQLQLSDKDKPEQDKDRKEKTKKL